MSKIRHYPGEVLSYDRNTLVGQLQLSESGIQLGFHAMLFHQGILGRSPRRGDTVSVALAVEPGNASDRDIFGVWSSSRREQPAPDGDSEVVAA